MWHHRKMRLSSDLLTAEILEDMQKCRHTPMKKLLVSRYLGKTTQTPGFCLPKKGNIRLFHLILNSILVMLCGVMKTSANVVWDPDVLYNFKCLCSFQTRKDPGNNNKLLQTWEGWEGKTRKRSKYVLYFFFLFSPLFPLFFFPLTLILLPSLTLASWHHWRQNAEIKGTLILLLDAGHAVLTTSCQYLRRHH